MIEFAEKLSQARKSSSLDLLKCNTHLVEYLKDNNLEEFYEFLAHSLLLPSRIGALTQFIIENGVNIFSYLDYVPAFCFYGTPIKEFEVPSNVKHILYKGFCKSSLEKIIFPENCALLDIGTEAFCDTDLTGIIELPKSMSFVEASAFNKTDISGLYLPKGCGIADPKSAEYYYEWRK